MILFTKATNSKMMPAYWILSCLLFILSLCFGETISQVVCKYAILFIFGLVLEIVRRVIQFMLSDDRIFNFVEFSKHLFDFNTPTYITFSGSLGIAITLNKNVDIYSATVCEFFGVLLLMKAVYYDDCTYLRSHWIENSNGLDYGTGMAYSFFYGYLAITLPNKGDMNTGIKEAMQIYEDIEGITFAVKKIFILVPSMLYCPPNLQEACNTSDVHLEACKNLAPVQRDVAGVTKRIYKHSVYKIHTMDGSLPLYVVAEGATPLLTYHKVVERSGPHQEHYKKHTKDIILQFYHTLKNIIKNDVECKDLCEIIYYDNLYRNVNVARLLLDKVYEVRKN